MMRVILTAGFVISAAMMSGQNAGAQTATASLGRMLDCRSIPVDADRLRCYDAASAQVERARTSGELVALDRSKLDAAQKGQFGLAAPRQPRAGGRDQLTDIQHIEAKVLGVQESGYGRYRLELAGDSVWETAEPMSFAPKVGETLTVNRAGFGGFRGVVGKGRSFLVKRIR